VSEEIEEVKRSLAVLSERVGNWMDTTNEYRKSLCGKIDVIQDKLNNLPCEYGNARYQGLANQIKWLWGLLCSLVLLVVSELWRKR